MESAPRSPTTSVTPAAPAAPTTPRNLPIPLASCVGRARDAAEIQRLLGATRLLTLAGVGGVGKTRLALHVAAAALPQYAGGARFVDLAPVADPTLVPQVTATACGVREAPGRPLLATLADALRMSHVLLVLDNCEHLVGACAALADTLLRACPQLRILATSREALGIAGETVWQVLPLPVGVVAATEGAEPGAVALFIERAQAAAPGFVLGPGDLELVAEVCRRLDGLPLAIELAAARTRALSLPELVRRLDDRFRLLTASNRTSPAHQHTLRAAMDWSHELLDDAERTLFRRLSVFAGGTGGFTLAAVEAVCADFGLPILAFELGERSEGESASPSPSPPSQSKSQKPKAKIEPGDVLDLLARLVDKSLVTLVAPTGGGPASASRATRYGLLETVRDYGAEQLRAAGEEDDLFRRHATYYVSVAETAAPALTGPEQATWINRLDAEHDNLRWALRWAVDDGDVAIGLRLGGALWRFWQARGHLSEGQRWLEAALARGDDEPAHVRAAALTAAGNLALARGAPAEARRFHEENLAVRRTIGDPAGIASTLRNLGLVAVDQGDLKVARALFEESLTLERDLGDRWRIALALHCLGALSRDLGDGARAQRLSAESLALFRELGDRRASSLVLLTLGSVALDRREIGLARARNEESLTLCRSLGDQRGIGLALNQLAKVAYAAGEYEESAALCAQSLSLAQALGTRREAASCIEVLAAIVHRQGQHHSSARLFGAAAALRQATGTTAPPAERRLYEQVLDSVRDRLGAEAFTASWEAGRAISSEQATALALQVASHPAPPRPVPAD